MAALLLALAKSIYYIALTFCLLFGEEPAVILEICTT